MKVTEQKQIKNSIKIYPLDFYLLNPFSLDFNSIPPLNVNARSLADVDQAADVPEVVAQTQWHQRKNARKTIMPMVRPPMA